MGFDISYHPICREQMNQWYFSLLNTVKSGEFSKLYEIGNDAGLDTKYTDKYISVMKVAAATKPDELFEKTHAYYLAVVQGFFLPYYYTRGTGFSFLIEEIPQMKGYTTSWNSIRPDDISCPVTDTISENYSGGVYISPEQVKRLLDDYENKSDIHKIISDFFEQNTPVFLKALKYASKNGLGLIEATEVVEPNPTDLNKTVSYSNLMNCDTDGVIIYRDAALKQIEEFMRMQEKDENTDKKKRGGFFKRLFKR